MTPRKKLIEVALPLPEINDASAYDKMPGIGPHPKGIHHWWARLPLPTARAVLFASVVDDPSSHPEKWLTEEAQDAERERIFDVIRRLMGKKLHEHPEVYAEAHARMSDSVGEDWPATYDPFAGGGSIPLEASRLGFEAHAGDLNPVAVLLNRCTLEIAPRWAGVPPVNPVAQKQIAVATGWRGAHGLAADVRHYGAIVSTSVREELSQLYPVSRLPKEHGGGEASVVAWIWARTVASPDPGARGAHVPLVSSFVLSTKKARQTWVDVVKDKASPDGWRFEVGSGTPTSEELKKAKLGTRAGKAQDFMCALTKTPIPRSYIQAEGKANRLRQRLMSVVADSKSGRVYLTPDEAHEAIASRVADRPAVAEEPVLISV